MKTVSDIIRHQATVRPDDVAVEYAGRELTYAALHERSSRVAQALLSTGVRAQERVAFLDKNAPEFFEVLFGAAKINAVTVALNWRLALPELTYVVNDTEASVLVVGPDLLPEVEKIRPELRHVEHVIVTGDGETAGYERWVAEHPPVDPQEPAGPDDVVMQVYTSGTTGLPKGAMLTNGNLEFLLPRAAEAWGFDEHTVSMVAMPLFHVSGGGWGVVVMSVGGRAVLLREVDPGDLLHLIEDKGITVIAVVASVLQFLLQHPKCATTDFSSLQLIAYGGSPIPDDVLRRALDTFQADFVQLYGMTEACGAVVALAPEDHRPGEAGAERLQSCGKPYPWVELRVVDPEGQRDVGPREVGELWVRSRQVMLGYWKQPEATAHTITEDGWLRTGDLGYQDEDGYVYLHDRLHDMIISGGENVYPAEIENALVSHPSVVDAAAIGVPHERWGETVKAVVVLAPGSTLPEDELIEYCRGRLAGYKCPTSVDVVESLPRNASGKILRRELREPYWKGLNRRVN